MQADNPPRKHHYVPVFYLKQWSNKDGYLIEHRRIGPKLSVLRKHPQATGWQKDLYRIDGLPEHLAHEVERAFMSVVDNLANEALNKIVHDDGTPWDSKMRSAWSRFVLSLRFRNPENVAAIKSHMMDVWNAAVDSARYKYADKRRDNEPESFEEFLASIEPSSPHRPGLNMLRSLINSERMNGTLFDMMWCSVTLNTSLKLLTSDRPLVWPKGFDAPDCHIALPIGPNRLFVAAHNQETLDVIMRCDARTLVTRCNRSVVELARTFVWGSDEAQVRFVRNRIARGPLSQILTDEQKKEAIEAARQDN